MVEIHMPQTRKFDMLHVKTLCFQFIWSTTRCHEDGDVGQSALGAESKVLVQQVIGTMGKLYSNRICGMRFSCPSVMFCPGPDLSLLGTVLSSRQRRLDIRGHENLILLLD